MGGDFGGDGKGMKTLFLLGEAQTSFIFPTKQKIFLPNLKPFYKALHCCLSGDEGNVLQMILYVEKSKN